MSVDRYKQEYLQLSRLVQLLNADTNVPIRLAIQPEDLSRRKFKLRISGMRSLVANPDSNSAPARATFNLRVSIPPGYPSRESPDIWFEDPIPFHPHVFLDGRICWGTAWRAQRNLMLADWIRGVIEFLEYYQDPGSSFGINEDSPANPEAMSWWHGHRDSIARYVPPVRSLSRFRLLIDRAKGLV